ncbi:hypothetical protein AB9P05_16315 [Roseivirga sp. BDSF3-8]|uniref:hypothetical protein n=1 Tax=Roseivirga sp. BDSF3-8 TaxID=3241598 RepID=UPI003531820A
MRRSQNVNIFIEISRKVFSILEKVSHAPSADKCLLITEFENSCEAMLSTERYPDALLATRIFAESVKGNISGEKLAMQGYLLSKLLSNESRKECFGDAIPGYANENSYKIIERMKQMIF